MSRLLIIPDVHEHTKWVSKILEKESGSIDNIVMLGDWWDTYDKSRAGAKKTTQFLLYLDKSFGDKIIWIRANHDCSYYYAFSKKKNGIIPKNIDNPYYASGYSRHKAQKICKVLTQDFIDKQKLAVLIDNVLYSHAGATPDLFKILENGLPDIEGFLEECEKATKEFLINTNHPFFRVGRSRGGKSVTGGLTWCDGNDEFYSHKDLPFMVMGHTKQYKAPYFRSGAGGYCILDCGQTFYAIIEDGKTITFKNIYEPELKITKEI